MKSRLLVAAVGVPLLLVVLLACPKFVTALMIMALSAIGAVELMKTIGAGENRGMTVLAAVMAAVVPAWCYFTCAPETKGLWPASLVGAALVFLFALILFALALKGYPNTKFIWVAGGFFAGVLIPLCLASVVRIILMDAGRFYVLLPIMIPFIADAGGYFGGRFFGKHKLAPALSPKKTVEGAIGGLVVGAASMMIFGAVVVLCFHRSFNFGYAAVYGVLGSVISIIGDLSFSMIKRENGIKDYGKLFRAHGGVLDRFDSVIFSAPLVELLILLLPVMA